MDGTNRQDRNRLIVCKSFGKADIDWMKRTTASDVPGYISGFPPKQRKLLKQLRTIVRRTAPKANEVISYGIPGYKYLGMLVYFAGFENHVGFYPGKAPLVAFKKKLSGYKTGKGSVQFPLDEALPQKLIQEMVQFRVKENETKSLARR